MQMIGRTAFAPKEVADFPDHLTLAYQAAVHHSIRVELPRKHMQVAKTDALIRRVGDDVQVLLAPPAQHLPVAHGDPLKHIGLSPVRPFSAPLTVRSSDTVASLR